MRFFVAVDGEGVAGGQGPHWQRISASCTSLQTIPALPPGVRPPSPSQRVPVVVVEGVFPVDEAIPQSVEGFAQSPVQRGRARLILPRRATRFSILIVVHNRLLSLSVPSPSGRGPGEGVLRKTLACIVRTTQSSPVRPHPNPLPEGEGTLNLRSLNTPIVESVASLQRIVLDGLNLLPYSPGLNHTTEGGHVGTGRIPSGLYRGNYSC